MGHASGVRAQETLEHALKAVIAVCSHPYARTLNLPDLLQTARAESPTWRCIRTLRNGRG